MQTAGQRWENGAWDGLRCFCRGPRGGRKARSLAKGRGKGRGRRRSSQAASTLKPQTAKRGGEDETRGEARRRWAKQRQEGACACQGVRLRATAQPQRRRQRSGPGPQDPRSERGLVEGESGNNNPRPDRTARRGASRADATGGAGSRARAARLARRLTSDCGDGSVGEEKMKQKEMDGSSRAARWRERRGDCEARSRQAPTCRSGRPDGPSEEKGASGNHVGAERPSRSRRGAKGFARDAARARCPVGWRGGERDEKTGGGRGARGERLTWRLARGETGEWEEARGGGGSDPHARGFAGRPRDGVGEVAASYEARSAA